MTCREIMNPDPPVVFAEETVGRALEVLLETRYLAVPVVDRKRRYLGLFARSRLFGMMLPSIVSLEDVLPKIAQLTDLAYLSDNLEDLRERFAKLREHPIGNYVDATAPTLRPDSPLMEAILLVYRTRNFVPVIDGDGFLIGMVSTWDVLAMLREPK